MAFVQLSKTSLAFGDRDILSGVTLYLSSTSRAALAGANGSGKSTFMKIIAGIVSADSGERSLQKGCKISYLPQSGIVYHGNRVRDEVETAFKDSAALIDEIEEISRILAHSGPGASTDALLVEYQKKQDYLENSGYFQREARITAVLSGLGFADSDVDRPVDEFSGGWQMRIALSKILLEAPDILLLDEPTNYLDIEARTWLESWLADFPGGFLLVSHDRYFLDCTVNEVYDLFQGNLTRYAGNYSAYESVRQQELDALLKHYTEQQEEIAKSEDLIRRFRYKPTKAAMVQERIRKLEKLERIEIPESFKKIAIRFPDPPHAGRIALNSAGIGKKYGNRTILSGLDLVVESGEKLVVVGRNGAGKSTLLRILAGVDPDCEGNVLYGAGIAVAYFSQESAELMTGSMTVLESIESVAPTALIPKIRDMLGAFLFRGDDVYKNISVLSGGEKSRLALLKLLLRPANLLILDEPTNHLDIYAKDVLLDTLKKYSGTVIFVSHDRAFMESLSTKTLELVSGGSHRIFYGNYAYYREKTDQNTVEPVKNIIITEETGTGKNFYELMKQQQSLVRKLEKQEAELLARIEALEKEKAQLESDLEKPEIYSNGPRAQQIQKDINRLSSTIDHAVTEWEAKSAELAHISGTMN
ncbi:ABC transporter ATP-binding protein [Spirochaetia bacterium]|nr:ABC transporter ATP-binding protein [Spirochaetia bacterium]